MTGPPCGFSKLVLLAVKCCEVEPGIVFIVITDHRLPQWQRNVELNTVIPHCVLGSSAFLRPTLNSSPPTLSRMKPGFPFWVDDAASSEALFAIAAMRGVKLLFVLFVLYFLNKARSTYKRITAARNLAANKLKYGWKTAADFLKPRTGHYFTSTRRVKLNVTTWLPQTVKKRTTRKRP